MCKLNNVDVDLNIEDLVDICSLNKRETLRVFKKMIEINSLLKNTDVEACFIETSENYTDCDEEDEFYDAPMFEAFLQLKDDSETVDDTTTGRYCSFVDVLDELEAFAIEYLESKELL